MALELENTSACRPLECRCGDAHRKNSTASSGSDRHSQYSLGRSRDFPGEKELERFQSELKQYFGVKHCFLVSSGKAAFALTLLALKELFPDRDEVLIPAFTCYSVPSSIVRARLAIRLCDLQVNSFDFDFAQLSAMLSKISPPLAETHPADRVSDSPVETGNCSDAPGCSTEKVLAIIGRS